jgi:hypothetical protein
MRVTTSPVLAPSPQVRQWTDMRTRVVEPELLETYPDDHPDAIRSREELLLVNAVMGNHRWMVRTLKRLFQPGWHITEIGAGDGALSMRFVESEICEASSLHAFDLARRPTRWPKAAAWTQGDFFHHPLPESEVLVANLILHHFKEDQLRVLGSRISPKTRVILAAEPARHRIHTIMGRFFSWLAELNPITCYDMQVSIRAGFRGDEVLEALGLGPEWQGEVRSTIFGALRVCLWR